jgi:hypothetical protein
MKIEEQKTKRLLDSRFSSIIFLLRLAGIPLKMKKISNIYAIYMLTAIFCTCTTVLGMFVDVCTQRDDLGHVTKNIRMLIPTANNWWIYAYARYDGTYVETLLGIITLICLINLRSDSEQCLKINTIYWYFIRNNIKM